MKPIRHTYRFFALTMAFLMFFSSVDFSIDMHFCQGQFKSFSLIGKAKNCHEMAEAVKSCHHHKNVVEEQTDEVCSEDKKNCCDSKTIHFQSDQDQINQSNDFIANQELQQFVIAYVAVFFQNDFVETDQPDFTNYRPPLISRDISVLYESFLL